MNTFEKKKSLFTFRPQPPLLLLRLLGPTSILQRGTTAVAVLVMCTSLGLAWYSQNRIGMDNVDRDSEVERLRQEQMERASTEKGIDIEVPEQPEMPPVVED